MSEQTTAPRHARLSRNRSAWPTAGEYEPGSFTAGPARAEAKATRVANMNSARAFLAQLEALRDIGQHDAAAAFEKTYAEELAEARQIATAVRT